MTSEPSDKSSRRTPARRPWRKRIVLILLVVGMAGALAGWWFHPAEPPPQEPAPSASDGDARLRKLVVGTWADEYKGKRTMTVHQDGTATMVVELEGSNALLGSRLRFEMEWSIEAGRLKKRTVGGEPSGRVNLILKAMGDRVDESILELTEQRLLLLDGDGRTRYDWRRVD